MSDHSVIIQKGKLFIKHWNSKLIRYEMAPKIEQVLSDVLQFSIIFKETTFGQFFDLIVKEKELYEKIFKSALYGHPLEPYVKECALPSKESKGLDFVEVYWHSELYEDELSVTPGFQGYGDWNVEGAPDKGGIAIEFTPLNEYKDKELKLNERGDIYTVAGQRPVLEARRRFTVYDVINAILYEITWAGDISKGRPKACEGEQGEAA